MAAKNATIGALRVELGLNTAQFDKGLKDAGGKLGQFGKLAAGAGVAVGVAMAGAAVALGAATRQALNTADEMVKTASKVGVAVDELSRLKHAADLSGVSMDGLSTALRKLSQNMMQTAEGGSSEAARAFQRLGISVTDSSGQLRDASAVLNDVAGRFAEMPDGVAKTATAVALFGRSGTDLIPMLNGGTESLAAMKAEADALGIVIDENTARAAEQFNDNLTRLGKVQEGIATQLAGRLAPGLAKVSDVLVGVAKDTKFMDKVGVVLDATLRGLVTSAIALAASFKLVGQTFQVIGEAIYKAFTGDLVGAWAALREGAAEGVAGVQTAVGQIKTLWSGLGDSAGAAAARVQEEAYDRLEEGAEDMASNVSDAADEAAKALEELGRGLDRVRDRVLGPEERRAKQIRADVQTVQQAFAQGLIDAAEMHALIEKMGGGLKLVTLPIVGDLERLADPVLTSGLDRLRDKADEMAEAFATVGWAVNDLAYSLKNGDWAGAARSFAGVVEQLKIARASGDRGTQYSAVGGLFAGAGSAVGGGAGVALSAVGSGFSAAGAAAGMAGMGALGGAIAGLAGPIGLAVGAIGLIAGMGARNAKKDAEAARKAQEAYQQRMAVLAQKREMELRLMELQGNAAGALAQRRADELAAMDAQSRALQAQIYALEDKAELEAKRAGFDSAFLSDQERISATMAAVAGELARLGYVGITARDQFKALVLSLDQTTEAGAATYRALLEVAPKFLEVADYLDQVRASAEGQVEAARQGLIAAYERESGALRTVIDRFRAFADTLRRFRDSLIAGTAANLSPAAQYQISRRQFEDVRARAAGGDEAAIEDLPSYAQAFLDAAREIAPTAVAYARDLAGVRNAVQAAEQIARTEADLASAQLAALETQVGQLVQLNEGVRTVAEAIAHLAAVEAQAAASIAAAVAQAAAVTSIPPAPADQTPRIWTPEGYAAANPDVAAWSQSIIGTPGYDGVPITSAAQALAYHWKHHGSMEGRGFATGGSFKVGGYGGPDSQFMPLFLSPGEMVDVRRPGAMREDLGAGFDRAVAELRINSAQSVVTLKRVERLMDRWEYNGLYVRGPEPDEPVAVNGG